MKKILIIQTAFIGDVVLITSMLETIHHHHPNASLTVLVRKGNEALFHEHPFVQKIIVWDKQSNKYLNWIRILFQLRSLHFDTVINVQRYAATGLWTGLSNAAVKIGFDKNPFSFLFTHAVKHNEVKTDQHEIHRNHELLKVIDSFSTTLSLKPKLYPSTADYLKIKNYQNEPYICIAPASVWFTKQFPMESWVQLIEEIPFNGPIYIMGGKGDQLLADQILNKINNLKKTGVLNMAGKFSFLASAALQQNAVINYVNDSAPMHFASAMNAPVVAIYCSTVPEFGYGPLSDTSFIVQTKKEVVCRPCGIHGKSQCPLKHFDCAKTIELADLIKPLLQITQQ